MSDDELAEHLTELERASRVIEAERSRAIVEADARRSYVADGFLATSSWLAHRLGVSASTAAQQVRLARALARMHRTRSALANGEISTAAAAVLATAHEADRDRFGEAEPVSSTRPERCPSGTCSARSSIGRCSSTRRVAMPQPRDGSSDEDSSRL
jgi:Domain of unknown function (DUF222)